MFNLLLDQRIAGHSTGQNRSRLTLPGLLCACVVVPAARADTFLAAMYHSLSCPVPPASIQCTPTARTLTDTRPHTIATPLSTLQKTNIDDLEKVMDEISETNDQMRSINDAFATPSADLDDDELMNELNELEATELDKQLMEPASVPVNRAPAQQQSQAMPNAPTNKQQAPSRKTAEELELEQLQAEMAL